MNNKIIFPIIVIHIILLGGLIYIGIIRPNKVQLAIEAQIHEINKVWDTKEYQSVIELCDDFLQEHPDNSNILMLKGFALFNIAYYDSNIQGVIDTALIWKSIYAIRRSLILGVDKSLLNSAYYILGKNYYFLSDKYLFQAIDYLEQAIANKYHPTDIYEYLSSSYLALGKVHESIKILQSVLKKRQDLSTYLQLIDIHLEQGDIAQGKDYLYKAEDIVKSDLEKLAISLRNARILLHEEKISTAISLLTEITETYPQSVEAHYYLGNAYELQGDTSKARYEWRNAYKMSPNWDKVIKKLDQDIQY